MFITEERQFELKSHCIEECPSSLLEANQVDFEFPSEKWLNIFFLTCKFMFSQVKCIERRQSFSLGMSDLKKKNPSIFAYKDWNSCCPLRKHWKNLSMTHWNHICYCSNNNNGFSIIQYHRRNITGHAIEDRALEAMKY